MGRRDRTIWIYYIVAILLILYGGYFIISSLSKDGKISIWAIIAVSTGGVMILIVLILKLIDKVNKKNHKEEEIKPV